MFQWPLVSYMMISEPYPRGRWVAYQNFKTETSGHWIYIFSDHLFHKWLQGLIGGRSVASQNSKIKQVVTEYIYSVTTCFKNDFRVFPGGRSVASQNSNWNKWSLNIYIQWPLVSQMTSAWSATGDAFLKEKLKVKRLISEWIACVTQPNDFLEFRSFSEFLFVSCYLGYEDTSAIFQCGTSTYECYTFLDP